MATLSKNGTELARLAIEIMGNSHQKQVIKIISFRSNGWILKKYKHTDHTTGWKRDIKYKYEINKIPEVVREMKNCGWTCLA